MCLTAWNMFLTNSYELLPYVLLCIHVQGPIADSRFFLPMIIAVAIYRKWDCIDDISYKYILIDDNKLWTNSIKRGSFIFFSLGKITFHLEDTLINTTMLYTYPNCQHKYHNHNFRIISIMILINQINCNDYVNCL